MKTLKAYMKGLQTAWYSKKLTTVLYLIYLILALLLAIPFYRLFISITGNSMLPDALLSDFNMTVVADLIRDGGKVFQVYISGLWPWLIAFTLLGTWLLGGTLGWIASPKGQFKLRPFLTSCSKYFWRFFRISLYVILLQVLVAILVYLLPVILISGEGLTDQYVVRTLGIGILIHLIFTVFLTLVADFSRYEVFYHDTPKVFKILWRSVILVIRKFPKFFVLYLIWLIIPVFLIYLLYSIRIGLSVDSGLMILLVFVIHQLFIWLRYFTRIHRQAMYYQLFLNKKRKD